MERAASGQPTARGVRQAMDATMVAMTDGLCDTCGTVVHPGDRFCGNCGAIVTVADFANSSDDSAAEADARRPVALTRPVGGFPNPIAVAQMPTMPPPVGGPEPFEVTPSPGAAVTRAVRRPPAAEIPDGVLDALQADHELRGALDLDLDIRGQLRAGRRFRFWAGAGVVVLVAAIAALSVVLVSQKGDLTNEKAKLAQAQTALADAQSSTTTTGPGQTGAIGPIDPNVDPSIALKTQLAQVTAALNQAKTDLINEKQGRADDAAAAQAAAAQAQATAAKDAADLTAAQTAAATAQQQLTALQALFPLTAAKIAAAAPTGAFTATLTPGECTLSLCSVLNPLTLTIPTAATISGDRVNGALAFDGTNYANAGAVDLPKSPQCGGVDTASTYQFSVHPTGATVVNGTLQASEMAGSYTETISSGPCVGQHRTYAVTMSRN